VLSLSAPGASPAMRGDR